MLLRNIWATDHTDQHGLMPFCIFSCPFVSFRGHPFCRRQKIRVDPCYPWPPFCRRQKKIPLQRDYKEFIWCTYASLISAFFCVIRLYANAITGTNSSVDITEFLKKGNPAS
jgi:hypothetical protein